MKAKDLISLIFKTEESKEIQNSIFYNQFGIIGAYFNKQAKDIINERLKDQLNDLHKIACEIQESNPEKSEGILYTINQISSFNNL